MTPDPLKRPTVLFVCVHNAGRSQLAAGLAAQAAGDAATVISAGTEPDPAVDAVMLASLAEIGIDRSDQVPRLLSAEVLRSADVVVALKPDLALHPAAGIRFETWALPEPAEWTVEGIRPLREHLAARVRRLLDEL